jgi:Fe-S oxidoreductase
VRFGVLGKERCTGDPAKRTGNEYLFQELAKGNIDELRAAGAKKILTSCPHCLKTLGHDYEAFGFKAEVTHSAVFVADLMKDVRLQPGEVVTYHDPCYLGRYAGHAEEPRDLLTRCGADVRDPVRSHHNPFCCGAGGGLLFEEHEAGKRISQERFEQLRATGAPKVVTACPFCSIMLKGAQASANATTEFVDLMTFVDGKLKSATRREGAGSQTPDVPSPGLRPDM